MPRRRPAIEKMVVWEGFGTVDRAGAAVKLLSSATIGSCAKPKARAAPVGRNSEIFAGIGIAPVFRHDRFNSTGGDANPLGPT